VPQRYKTEEGYRLGQWVNAQRANKAGLDPNRMQRLEALSGWDWNPNLTQWEEGFSRLKQFSEQRGHCVVTRDYETEDGYRLGAWVSSQRKNKGLIQSDRRQLLEALSGWDWNPNLTQWEEGFSRLKQFSEQWGHCLVTRDYETEDGYRLGVWVNRQRISKNSMRPDRRQRLEALVRWSWKPHFDLWEMGFSKLKHFSDREGHCRVPQKYKTEEGYRLGRWVKVQRTNRERMAPHRRQRLDAFPGWDWDELL
jgi:hypothetical protein